MTESQWLNRAVTAYEEAADFTDTTRLEEDATSSGIDVLGFHPDTLAEMRSDVLDFADANATDVFALDPGAVGHDFWLTRNRHGAGFWDGDYPADLGRRLTDSAHAWGEVDLYVGDDGWVYHS
jgi:hypothetical protein